MPVIRIAKSIVKRILRRTSDQSASNTVSQPAQSYQPPQAPAQPKAENTTTGPNAAAQPTWVAPLHLGLSLCFPPLVGQGLGAVDMIVRVG